MWPLCRTSGWSSGPQLPQGWALLTVVAWIIKYHMGQAGDYEYQFSLNSLKCLTNLHPQSGKPYWRGRISTVDLLVLISLDVLLLIFTYITNQAFLIRRRTVLSLLHQLVFPAPILTARRDCAYNKTLQATPVKLSIKFVSGIIELS